MKDQETYDEEAPYEGPDPLSHAVKTLFGLDYLFPNQRLVISNILEAAAARGIAIDWPGKAETPPGIPEEDDKRELGRQIVILPTGAGKSLCFQLPAMLMKGPTLVIYPILGLMADQERRLASQGFSPVLLRGGQSKEERDLIWAKLRSGESRFLIANPEVLLSPQVMGRLGDLGLIHIVIDEAHCVSEWGESFRPSYLEIGRIIEAAGRPLVTAFTATAGTLVLEKIQGHIFGEGGAALIVGNPDRKNIYYSAQGCILRNLAVRDLILKMERPAIVFCSSRRGTEILARYLRCYFREKQLPWYGETRFYHAGLSREEKKETEDWFLQSREGVLTATCAYGLGIDKSDIRTVIHRDCPSSVEAYLQESGRAGRDGKQSRAVLLYGPADTLALTRAQAEPDRLRVSKLLAYAREPVQCRRETLLDLLDYRGDRDSPGPVCCDVCGGTSRTSLREEASLLDFFKRNQRVYTRTEAALQLARIEGVGWSKDEAGEVISYLLKMGMIRASRNILWRNKIICAKQEYKR